MKRNKILILSLIILIIVFALIMVFTKNNKSEGLKTGKYVIQDSEYEDLAWILLEENNEFKFNRNSALSYLPIGTYSVNGDKLILYVNKNESYKFIIEEDKLIYEGSSTEFDVLRKGSVFKLKR